MVIKIEHYSSTSLTKLSLLGKCICERFYLFVLYKCKNGFTMSICLENLTPINYVGKMNFDVQGIHCGG